MMGGLTLPLLSVVLVILATTSVGKGSESHGSSADESGEDEDYSEPGKGGKGTGAQHKFWMPTYQGTNPLNRRKISITTSEIQKYDRSIDVSLSGVNRNRTNKLKHQNDQGTLSMPIIWSGEYSDINKSRKYDISMESSKISVEFESDSSLSQNVKDISSATRPKGQLRKNRIIANEKRSKSSSHQFTTVSNHISVNNKAKKQEIPKSPKNKTKYVEKTITSQFFNELSKATFNETVHTPEYYSKLVKSATKLTKEKLGYQKAKDVPNTGSKTVPTPEIIAVNIDSKSFKSPAKIDEIVFKTGHKQLIKRESTETLNASSNRTKDKMQSKSKTKNKPLNIDTSSFYNLDDMPSNSAEGAEDSFTEFCDYSAWSDVLTRNKTERKASKRKPKTKPISSSYRESREMGKPLGKDEKYKANKLRQKEGTISRKKKRQRELKKKKQSSKRESRRQDHYDDDYDQKDYPEKKLRMRTKGEKQHAINEVKGYLKTTDNKYGGRPGRDNYQSKYDRSEKEFKSYERRDERIKGRDRRKEREQRRDSEGGNRWNDRENNRDRKWGQREYRDDRRNNYDRENQWDTGRRGRGMFSGRGGRQSGWRGDDRRSGWRGDDRRSGWRGDDRRSGWRGDDRRSGWRGDDRRSGWRGERGSRRGSRDGYSGRGRGGASYRGSGRGFDRRGRGRDGDRRGSGRDGDRRGRGRDGDRRGSARDGDRRGSSFRGNERSGPGGRNSEE